MPHNCPMWSPTWGNSARTSDSGSCGPTPLASVVGVTDGIWLSLGYEHYDAHLRRLGPSLDVELAWTDGQAEVALGPRCLRRSALSRAVPFTDSFTNAVLDWRGEPGALIRVSRSTKAVVM